MGSIDPLFSKLILLCVFVIPALNILTCGLMIIMLRIIYQNIEFNI